MRTADMTRTALRNISTAPSQLDQARKQARTGNCVVGFLTQLGAQVSFPTDSATGDTWPVCKLGVEALYEAQELVESQGRRFEVLA